MKRPTLSDRFGESESSVDDHVSETVAEALSSDDKIIEIRPSQSSSGMGLRRLLLLGAVAIGLAYWARSSQKPDQLIESVKEETASRTHRAAETIEKGSQTASERIESGSERASETVYEAGEKAAERTEEAGEKAAERTEEAGEKAAERTEEVSEEATDGSGSGSSSSSSSSSGSSSGSSSSGSSGT